MHMKKKSKVYEVHQSYPKFDFMDTRKIGTFKTRQSAQKAIDFNLWKNTEIVRIDLPYNKKKLKLL